jgi:YHS domain-containing protein
MYERNGKQMPSLDARQLPNTTRGPRTVGQKPGPKVQPAAAPQTAAAPRLLDRLFPWARRAKKTPQPAKSTSPAVRRAPNALPANIARKPVQSRPIARKKADTPPSLDGDIPATNNIKTAGKKPAAPTKAASQDDLPDLFPELSESEADGGSKPLVKDVESPFSGLKLTDDDPKSKDVRSNPSLDKPSKADEKKVAETKIDSERKEKLKKIANRSERKGLKGFCPVALRDDRELLDTVPDFRTVHGSKTFYFSSSDAKVKFDGAPQKYAPINNGNDIVLLNGEKKIVEGSLDHAVWYKDRLHLFSTPATLATFVQEIAKKRAVNESAKQADDDAEEDSEEAASAKVQDSSKGSFEKTLESKKK